MSPGLRKTTRKGPGAKDTPKCVYSLKIHFGVSLRCVYPRGALYLGVAAGVAERAAGDQARVYTHAFITGQYRELE